LQATISNLQERLEHSIDLTEAFNRESSCVINFIPELIDNLRSACPNRRYSPHMLSISHFLYFCSAKTYPLLRQLVPLPSVSQLYKLFQPVVLFEKQYLICLDSLHNLVAEWRCREGRSSDSPIKLILGVDAATFQPDAGTSMVDAELCKNGHLSFRCCLIRPVQMFPCTYDFFLLEV
jgi:hypothetical protein